MEISIQAMAEVGIEAVKPLLSDVYIDKELACRVWVDIMNEIIYSNPEVYGTSQYRTVSVWQSVVNEVSRKFTTWLSDHCMSGSSVHKVGAAILTACGNLCELNSPYITEEEA